MDAWQAALEDVGPAGLDGVKGGKYGRAGCSSRSTNTDKLFGFHWTKV